MSENRFDALFEEADAAFNGIYQSELDKLIGLSKEEVDAISPGTQDLRIYSVLIEVVKKASRENISQAELINNIKGLGGIAVDIAKKIPQLASFF
jgi:hypothetical protein